MIKISILLAVCVTLAWLSEKKTAEICNEGYRYSVWSDYAYLLLVLIIVLFAGLRTEYNDTSVYLNGFQNTTNISGFLSNSKNLNLFKNPLFHFYESILKTLTNNPQVLVFTCSAITQICFVYFFKQYSEHFTFSIFIYFTLGTFTFTMAAMKQVLAMGILTLSFPYLQRKQWIHFYFIVFIAMLIHTYAIGFAVLPLFVRKPWKPFTYVFLVIVIVIMMNFKDIITEFLEQANELGKNISNNEVFDDHTINIFRLAVYIVTPLISFLFQRWVLIDSSTSNNTLIHMSIISLAFMLMGTQSGANMFARMAHYFEIGTICCLPRILYKSFDSNSSRHVTVLTVLCFIGFFVYANGINSNFDQNYQFISLWEFLFN